MEFADTRYNRQELMPQIGVVGQHELANARVVVIGAGGVKSPFLYYLAAAGVGQIRIIDHDKIEVSNLNRQILFGISDIGRSKAEVAGERLRCLNDEIGIDVIPERVDERNVADLCRGYDVVVEGGDSLPGRRLINSYCLESGQPMVHASAQYGYGYVLSVLPRKTACFTCVFPDLPAGHGGSVPVYGVATGLAGCLGAGEVIKMILGAGQLATDGILTFSSFQNDFDFVPSPRREDCADCGK